MILQEKCAKLIDFEVFAPVDTVSEPSEIIVNACKIDFLVLGTFPYLVALHKIGKMMK